MTDLHKIYEKLTKIHAESKENHGIYRTELKGINRRLDITNGRLAKNEGSIQDLEKTDTQISIRLSQLMEDNTIFKKNKRWANQHMISTTTSVITALAVAWLLFKTGLR